MIYYPIILWLVFFSSFSFLMGLHILLRRKKSSIYKLIFEKKNIYEFAQTIGPMVSDYIPSGKQMELSNKLMYANYPLGLKTESFIGLQLILMLGGLILGLMLASFGLPSFLAIILVGLAYLFPTALLNEKVEKRQKVVRRDLPSMVGLLSTSIKAGVELGSAFEVISSNIPDVLGEELRKAMKELATGSQRAKALKRMCDRLGVDSLTRFIETINTAEERGGMNLSQVLEDFTEDMRIMQKLDLEEKAKKIPTKMLLPIFACIFLPMLVMLLTPLALTLANGF